MINMFNKMPHFVYINNRKYFVKTDYRLFIDFEIKMQGENKREVCINTLKKFYPAFLEIINNNLLEEAIDKFVWFYKCGKTDVEIQASNKSNSNMRIYDYNYDSDLIWGAFKEQYNIELDKVYLHWWKFKAMWVSLKKDCQFSIIRGYRAYNGKDKELLELKEMNKLPLTEKEIDEQKRHKTIFDELNKITSKK